MVTDYAIEAYSLKLITAPTVWVATAEDFHNVSLRPQDDDAQDGQIVEWIKAATEMVENLADRVLISTTYELRLGGFPGVTASFAGTNGSGIRLPKGPWQSITSVQYYNGEGTLTTLSSASYLFDEASGWLTPIYGGTWPSAQYRTSAARIRFLSGFGTTASSVPLTLKRAVVATVVDWIANPHGRFELPTGVAQMIENQWSGTMI